ncbi:MAG: IclR family transcriptional regulator [Tissierellia bacterium]|nr:IclR family transcriptional regulator [Tissierellia bacterium]
MSEQVEVKSKKTIKSVEKAFALIDYLAQTQEDQGVTEISSAMQTGVSATYHMLNTLKEAGIIEQNSLTKKYRLGLKLWQIGMLAYRQNQLASAMKPFLRKLMLETGETANLTVLDNNKIVYIAQEESDHLLKMFTKIGASAPLHCTGAGKVLLAYLPEYKQKQILDEIELKPFTSKTLTTEKDLREEMQRIRNKGYGTDDEERELGVSCVGAPIFGPDQKVVACISVSGPKERFSEENKNKWIEVVMAIAKEATEYIQDLDAKRG